MRGNLIETYLLSLKSARRSNNTLESYGRQLDALESFLRKKYQLGLTSDDVPSITPEMMTKYYATLSENSPTTNNLYVTYIQSFFRFLVDMGYVDPHRNPSRVLLKVRILVDEVKDERRSFDNIYSPEDVKALLSAAGVRNRVRNHAIVALILGSGLRISEVCSLNLGDMRNHIEQRVFPCRRKGGGRYWVPLAPFAVPFINAFLEKNKSRPDDEPLFVSEQGNRLNRNTGYRIIANLQKQIQKSTGAHRLRHAFLTDLHNACADDNIVQDVASHRSQSTTRRYIHTSLEQRRDAVRNVSWTN